MAALLGLDKLVEIAASGLAAVAGPLLAPWTARREGQARIIAAVADAKVLQIQTEALVKARDFAVARGAVPGGEIGFSDRHNERLPLSKQNGCATNQVDVRREATDLGDIEAPNSKTRCVR